MTRILLIEDEPSLVLALTDRLRAEGYDVVAAEDGETGWEHAAAGGFDLVLLDLMLPGLPGREILRRMRDGGDATVVLVLTARTREEEKVDLLDLGADDYVVKPFGLAELLARVESRLRAWDRERGLTGRTTIRVGGATVDFRARTIRRGETTVNLTPKELDLLRFFTTREGEALSRARILAAVWREDSETTSRVVDMTVLGLRRKLEEDPSSPKHVVTVSRVGYRFER